MERTLIIVKPDGVQRGLVGPVLARFEARGLKFAGLKLMRISR
ncbi:MAG: nucleoside-diphosphate kinase, partial [Ktedonobacterales bacterium]